MNWSDSPPRVGSWDKDKIHGIEGLSDVCPKCGGRVFLATTVVQCHDCGFVVAFVKDAPNQEKFPWKDS
jgi:hypothetical protein